MLFGTPLLLLFGYPFLDILLILLPISASINALQISKDYKHINFNSYKNVLFITVPFIIVFLFLASKNKIDINMVIGIFLIFIALKNYVKIIRIMFEKILSYNKIFYSIMGIVHGVTNLGGALLTARIFHETLNKYEKRATIAISYMTFAIFQIVTILFLDVEYDLSNLWYVFIGISTYITINKIVFHKVSDHKYNKIFSIFLLASGVLLVMIK